MVDVRAHAGGRRPCALAGLRARAHVRVPHPAGLAPRAQPQPADRHGHGADGHGGDGRLGVAGVRLPGGGPAHRAHPWEPNLRRRIHVNQRAHWDRPFRRLVHGPHARRAGERRGAAKTAEKANGEERETRRVQRALVAPLLGRGGRSQPVDDAGEQHAGRPRRPGRSADGTGGGVPTVGKANEAQARGGGGGRRHSYVWAVPGTGSGDRRGSAARRPELRHRTVHPDGAGQRHQPQGPPGVRVVRAPGLHRETPAWLGTGELRRCLGPALRRRGGWRLQGAAVRPGAQQACRGADHQGGHRPGSATCPCGY